MSVRPSDPAAPRVDAAPHIDATPSVDAAAWIRCYHEPAEDAPQLACFPHAGGSASFYFPLSVRLAPGVETLAVQYPGRQDRRTEPALTSVESLAEHAVAALRLRRGTDRPPALFGHSMGALVAFEVAKRLECEGTPPSVLIVSGRRAPDRSLPETVHLRDDAGVLEELRALSGTDERFFGDEELVRMILPTIRADYRALAAYRPESPRPLGCPIVALVGDGDPVAPVEDARCWAHHTTADFELHILPGGHFYLADRQEEVTALITRALHTYG